MLSTYYMRNSTVWFTSLIFYALQLPKKVDTILQMWKLRLTLSSPSVCKEKPWLTVSKAQAIYKGGLEIAGGFHLSMLSTLKHG